MAIVTFIIEWDSRWFVYGFISSHFISYTYKRENQGSRKGMRLPRSHSLLKKGTLKIKGWQGGSEHKTISETHGDKRKLTPQSCSLPHTHTPHTHTHTHMHTIDEPLFRKQTEELCPVLMCWAGKSLLVTPVSLCRTLTFQNENPSLEQPELHSRGGSAELRTQHSCLFSLSLLSLRASFCVSHTGLQLIAEDDFEFLMSCLCSQELGLKACKSPW